MQPVRVNEEEGVAEAADPLSQGKERAKRKKIYIIINKRHNHDTKYKQTLAPAQPEPRRCWAEMSHWPSGFQPYNGSLRCLNIGLSLVQWS